jgi:pimeloyl-ACP methyl ester carboxylesterase
MAVLVRDGLRLVYEIEGRGAPLLLPLCNFRWTDAVVERLADSFTVVMASPRGFADSDRLPSGATYLIDDVVGDLIAVLRHAGHERAAVLGYSFVAGLAAWMARTRSEVTAAVIGGFPVLGDYRVTLRDVQRQHVQLISDPVAAAQIAPRFDPWAAFGLYQALGALKPDALVDEARCPLYVFWGARDEEVGMVMPSEELSAGLAAREVAHQVVDGLDHEGLNSRVEIALDDAITWLATTSRASS